jgi:aerobic carbon-monoxide dehydrogenase small subunit
MQTVNLKLQVNGKPVQIDCHPMARLLDVLRDTGFTGTKEGCGEGECGACSIFLDGKLVNSCLVPALQAQQTKIETVEGLAIEGKLHPIQKAFWISGGAQCGICTPGMVMAAVDLLKKNKNPNLEQIREGLAGNLCRCTGYMKIFDSVLQAASEMKGNK